MVCSVLMQAIHPSLVTCKWCIQEMLVLCMLTAVCINPHPCTVHSLPQNVDKIVRVEMCVLVKIVSKIAPYWDRIGHHLKLTKLVTELRKSKSSDVVKMTILFEQWVERKDESLRWEVLLNILEEDLKMLGVGAKLRQYILEAVSCSPPIPSMYAIYKCRVSDVNRF